MSGSPIYIGANLVGALSGSFPFSEQPIATVTPIEGMLRPEIGGAGHSSAWGSHTPLFGVGSGFDEQTLSFLTTSFSDLNITFRQGGGASEEVAEDLYPGVPVADGTGPTIHLAVSDDLAAAMNRVKAAGGSLVSPIIEIPAGRFVYCLDPDGNSISLFAI